MLEAALEALMVLADPTRILFMIFGIIIGCIIGVLPGLGGTVGLSLVLPFIYGMDPYTALALLISLAAVTTTADSFTSILFGVPGSSGSQSTILDGHSLALKGEGARALSAAFVSSMLGGIIGAIVLFISIPIAKPLILSFGSPELFMLTILGISTVAIVVGNQPLRGFLIAVFGLFIGTIGGAPATPQYRYTFDWLYLFDGIPLIVIVLGFFAIPEMIQFLSSNDEGLTRKSGEFKGTWQGIKDVFKNIRLVFQGASIGSFIGFLPGIGGTVVDWLCYGIAKKTVKNNENFGKGDIRGVIAPESGTNAKDGGSLIPTLLFAIPGSPPMAVLLGGFMLLGIEPGPQMITTDLPITFSIIWSLVFANVIATLLCLAISKPFSRILNINPNIFVPFIIVIIFVGAYQASYHLGDFIFLFVIGFIGWILKELSWPRIPFIIGFVLSTGAERYLFLSISSYGFSWLYRPGVIIIGIIILLLLLGGYLFDKSKLAKREAIS